MKAMDKKKWKEQQINKNDPLVRWRKKNALATSGYIEFTIGKQITNDVRRQIHTAIKYRANERSRCIRSMAEKYMPPRHIRKITDTIEQ